MAYLRLMGTTATALLVLTTGCSNSTTDEPTQSPAASTIAPAPISGSALVIRKPTTKGSTTLMDGKLVNTSAEEISVVGGSAYFASQLQVIQNGKPVQLKIPANASVALSPTGYQIKIIGLTKTLKSGTNVPVNIILSSGQAMTVKAKVA